MQGSFDIIREIDIDASPELAFRFLTDAALLPRWLCVQAEIDPRPGGGYVLDVTGSRTTRGTFLALEPVRRLVYTWLFDHVEPPLRTTVAVRFTLVGRGTRVRLRHHGFVDQPTSDRHAAGWAHYTCRGWRSPAPAGCPEQTNGAPERPSARAPGKPVHLNTWDP